MSRRLDTEATIRPIRFAHIVLKVRDIERAIDWYRTVIGMEIAHHAGKIAFLTYDDEHHRIAFLELPDDAPPLDKSGPGIDHLAYTYADLGQLLSTYLRLKSLNILPYWQINHGPTTSLYYRDPDGVGVELQVDNFESIEALQGWMRSDTFRENPIGVPFDADRLAERYLAGDPLEVLLAQGATS